MNTTRLIWATLGVAATACCATLSGCASPARATTLSADDLETTSNEMAAKLRDSQFLRERTPDSERMVIAINKVENLTSDIIPSGEAWWMMTRVRDSIGIQVLSKEKNIRFVIPEEFLRQARGAGTLPADAGLARNPTHEMGATFRSVTRAASRNRTDAYLCEFRISSLADGETKWLDAFEFKKTAVGRSYD